MKAKKFLYWFFLIFDVMFALCTLLALAIFPPVGIIGIFVTTLYTLVVISIRQSIKGRKPIFNLFREGEKVCKKCGKPFSRKFISSFAVNFDGRKPRWSLHDVASERF